MNQQKLLFFGDIDLDQVKNEYTSSLQFDGKKITINLNIFETETITTEILTKTQAFLELLEDQIRSVNKYVLDDYESEGEAYGYVEHHIENLTPEEITEILGKYTPEEAQEDDLAQKLRINRIAIFPEDDDEFAVFDVTIGEQYTDHVIAVYTDIDGKLIDLGIES